jgi:hypothetical protein
MTKRLASQILFSNMANSFLMYNIGTLKTAIENRQNIAMYSNAMRFCFQSNRL